MSNFPVPKGYVECPACNGTGNIRRHSVVLRRCERCDGYGYHHPVKLRDWITAVNSGTTDHIGNVNKMIDTPLTAG